MKESEIISMIEGIDIRDVAIAGHKERLAAMLRVLDGRRKNSRTNPRVNSWNIFRSPKWRLGLASAALAAVAVSLGILVPPMFGRDHNVLAAEIALKSPDVIQALGDDDVVSTEVIAVDGNIYTVEITGSSGTQIEVTVDMERKAIMDIFVGPPQNFENEDIERVINILQTDSTAASLLAQGAVIKSIMNYSISMDVAKIGETSKIVEKKVNVTIELGDKLYLADIELVSGRLLGFGDYDAMKIKPTMALYP